MGPPPLFRALLENENDLGMCAAHRRVARREICPPQGYRRRHFLGKAADLKEYWAPPQNPKNYKLRCVYK